jgi:hypothetical protein
MTKTIILSMCIAVSLLSVSARAQSAQDERQYTEGPVLNHGLETWQMIKPDGKTWKILSVVWSSHDGA